MHRSSELGLTAARVVAMCAAILGVIGGGALAQAATVTVVPQHLSGVSLPGDPSDQVIRYDAAAGEVNHLTVARTRGPGAELASTLGSQTFFGARRGSSVLVRVPLTRAGRQFARSRRQRPFVVFLDISMPGTNASDVGLWAVLI